MDDPEELVVGEYNTNNTPSNQVEPECVQIIRKLDKFTPEIIEYAIDVYYTIERNLSKCGHKVIKQHRRKKRIFVCIYLAYNRLGTPVDPKYITRLLDSDISIDEAFNENRIDFVVDPIQLSRFYIQQLNELCPTYQLNVDQIQSMISGILDICKETNIGTAQIINMPAKNIAIGTLYLVLENQGYIDTYRSILHEAWYLTPACINRYYENISTLYNLKDNNRPKYTYWFDTYSIGCP